MAEYALAHAGTSAAYEEGAKGFAFDGATAKRKADRTWNAIYLKDGTCGFAVHLVRK